MAESCCGSEKRPARSNDELISPVAFPTRSRVHIAINVRLNVFAVAPFYRALLGAEPTTLVEKYAKFELDEPPLNLTINEFAENARGAAVFGVRYARPAALGEAKRRLETLGVTVTVRGGGAWVKDPDGNRWELFTMVPGRSALLEV